MFIKRVGGRSGYDKTEGVYGIIGPEDAKKQEVISGTTYKDTARFVLSSLLTPEASVNATLRVSSIDSKPAEMLDTLQKVEGKPVKARYTSLDDFKRIEHEDWEKDPSGATVYTLSRIWYEGGSDFTRKPRALYQRNGLKVEDKALESQLFQDVPRRNLEEVMRELLL